MKRTVFSTIIFALVLVFFSDAFAQTEISAAAQSDSPLLISNVTSKWRKLVDPEGKEWNMMTVEFNVQNVSGKAIRAYAIQAINSKGLGSSMFAYSGSASFKPSQIYPDSIGEDGYLEIPKDIKLDVDFVEFADGTTWGEDSTESAQQLAGLRAGAEAMLAYLRNTGKQNGIESAIKTLDETKDLVSPPENQNSRWQTGFRTGKSTVLIRLKKIYEKEGIKAFENELQKPFDAVAKN